MLQLGIRAHDTVKAPIEARVKNIAELGFCCTQLALKKAIHEFPVGDGAMTPGMALYLKRLFSENKVDIAVLGCYKNLANPDEGQLAEIMRSYEAHIRFASLLGCGMVGTETGAVNTEYKYTPENHTDAALRRFIESLKRVVEYAEKMGVLFGIEPVYKHIMYDLECTRKVLDAVASPNLRVIFDIVNVLNADNEAAHEDIIKGAFELFGDEIAVIHLKDYVVRDKEIISRPVTLGEGKLNVPCLMKQLKENKPFIHVLLEDSLPENAMQSKAYALRCYEEA